jgi:hypothetical protein
MLTIECLYNFMVLKVNIVHEISIEICGLSAHILSLLDLITLVCFELHCINIYKVYKYS